MDIANAITMTARVYGDYKKTVARHEPETVALLGGKLNKPNRITEFRFCPPEKKGGVYQSSSATVSVDADLMNWIISNEFAPNDRYILGLWHSHPGNVTAPSGEGGDLGAFEDFLSTTAAREAGWKTLLAPITTFDHKGRDTIHGWTYSQGEMKARPAPVLIEAAGHLHTPHEFERLIMEQPTHTTSEPVSKRVERTREVQSLLLEFDQAYCVLHEQLTGSWLKRREALRRFNLYALSEFDDLIASIDDDRGRP
ncbi:MAG: Mov34/MPN/PAD-1 family protein [Pseudomonadota bacterium]